MTDFAGAVTGEGHRTFPKASLPEPALLRRPSAAGPCNANHFVMLSRRIESHPMNDALAPADLISMGAGFELPSVDRPFMLLSGRTTLSRILQTTAARFDH